MGFLKPHMGFLKPHMGFSKPYKAFKGFDGLRDLRFFSLSLAVPARGLD